MYSGEGFSAETLEAAERSIGYTFRNKALLEEALTHKSYSNAFGGANNERLEFLGDAVLELIISERLFVSCPQAEEGELTALRQQYVSKTALGRLCKREKFMRFLRFSGGEQNLGSKTVESLPEALLGAVYLDGGMLPARAFVKRFLVSAGTENYKSLLQEYVQKRTGKTPEYVCREEQGRYFCTVRALERTAEGEGRNKQAAEFSAAEKLYSELVGKQ